MAIHRYEKKAVESHDHIFSKETWHLKKIRLKKDDECIKSNSSFIFIETTTDTWKKITLDKFSAKKILFLYIVTTIYCLVSVNIQQAFQYVQSCSAFSDTLLLHMNCHVRHHFVRLPLGCCLFSGILPTSNIIGSITFGTSLVG